MNRKIIISLHRSVSYGAGDPLLVLVKSKLFILSFASRGRCAHIQGE